MEKRLEKLAKPKLVGKRNIDVFQKDQHSDALHFQVGNVMLYINSRNSIIILLLGVIAGAGGILFYAKQMIC